MKLEVNIKILYYHNYNNTYVIFLFELIVPVILNVSIFRSKKLT